MIWPALQKVQHTYDIRWANILGISVKLPENNAVITE